MDSYLSQGYLCLFRIWTRVVVSISYDDNHYTTGTSLQYMHICTSGENHPETSQVAVAVEYTDCISAEGKDSPIEFPDYDTKQSNGKAPVTLELWEMQSTLSLPLLPGSLWPGMVSPDWVLSMGQIELFDI